MLLVIDNYDSFTYNLVHLVGQFRSDMKVVRNDALTVADVHALAPEGILISPGPGRPVDAGISEALIEAFGATTPILGVCLGHQAIGEVFGGTVTHAPTLMHGKVSTIDHDGQTIYRNVPQGFTATRYHSLVIDRATLPNVLEVTSQTQDGVIMGLRHKTLPIEGMQFHPESVLTTEGPRLLSNWLDGVTAWHSERLQVAG